MLIQLPSCLYHINIRSSTQMELLSEKVSCGCKLKAAIKALHNFQRWLSFDIPWGCLEGWSLNLIHQNKKLNLIQIIPVRPRCAAGIYFDGAVVDQSDARVENSNLVIRTKIPKNFRISSRLVSLWFTFCNCGFVSRIISVRWFGGNINKKTSRQERWLAASLLLGPNTMLEGVLKDYSLTIWAPFK